MIRRLVCYLAPEPFGIADLVAIVASVPVGLIVGMAIVALQ